MAIIQLYLLSFLLSLGVAVTPTHSTCDQQCHVDKLLGPELSKRASIVHTSSAAPRWSEFHAPNPGTIVNVASENDVRVTVQYCNRYNLSFLAQGGGSGWADTFDIGPNDVLINLRGIRTIEFNQNKTQVTFQGGAIISEVVAAAYGNDTQVATGNCNCVGVLGAILGGGYGRLMGLYGLGVDNVLSLNLVTSNGSAIKVTPADTDLWWALRGAGANFGIVTSATMKAYPIPAVQNGAWLGPLIFTEDKIETLVRTINDLHLTGRMAIFLYYTTSGPPSFTPTIISIPFYLGNETEGRNAFSSILAVGPSMDQTAWTPYSQVNIGSNTFCVPGGRKPSYGAGFAQMDPQTWRSIWKEYNTFLKTPGVQNTTVLMEYYSMAKAKSYGDASSAFAFRSTIKYNGVVNTWYADPSLDGKAEAFGSSVRDLWRASGKLPSNSTYINYANGDEPLQTIYGENVARLQQIKRKYDPHGRFDQWFPLS